MLDYYGHQFPARTLSAYKVEAQKRSDLMVKTGTTPEEMLTLLGY